MTSSPDKIRPSSKRRSRRAEILSRLALSAASITLCLLVLEAVFRILEPKQPPGTTYGRPVSLNSHGLRERELAIPKPEGTFRLLVLGDSFTWGVGLDAEQSVPRLLEELLTADHASRKIEVVNAAIPGHNTVEQLHLFRETGQLYEPDLVLLIYNLNDIEYLPELAEGEPETETATPVVEIDPGEDVTSYSHRAGLRGMVLAVEKRSALTRFLVPRVGSLLRRLGLIRSVEFSWVAKVFQGFHDDNPGWRESRRALSELAAEARAMDIPMMVAIYPLFANLEDYQGRSAHAVIGEACAELGIPATDLLPLFENTRTRSHWINHMDSHPNARAHRVVAEHLLPLVERQMASRVTESPP